jgi:hypothetical protein
MDQGVVPHAGISALGSLRNEDHEFQASLDYISEILS